MGATLTAASPARAQAGGHPIPEAERWATITHPGNEAYVPPPTTNYPYPVGRVDYEYQISRTEVTVGEWVEFVNAYAPYITGPQAISFEFTGVWVGYTPNSSGYYDYYAHPEVLNVPVAIGWRYAARFCNWLHNGKALTRDAFETGAYDTSTFSDLPGGGISDQPTHFADARYWLPSIDEWTKAAFFDPDRYGEGQPGYWMYPHASDAPLIGGPPNQGGQTSAGYPWPSGQPPLDIVSYPSTQSPWGLWDLSGGVPEWLETIVAVDGVSWGRYVRGSGFRTQRPDIFDHIDNPLGSIPRVETGFRMARAIPSASGAMAIIGGFTCFLRRRRLSA